MITEKIESALLLGVLARLFASESEDDVTRGFDELERVGNAYAGKVAKAEADERKELGVGRTESAAAMADVAAEWGMVVPEKTEGDE